MLKIKRKTKTVHDGLSKYAPKYLYIEELNE